MTDEPKLLPCPFCGDDDITILPLAQDHAQAFCNKCLANGPSADEIGNWTRPYLAWNTRAVPQPPQEPTPEAVERAAVRVKPLEWVNLGGYTYRTAAPLFGSLRIESYSDTGWSALYSVPGYCDTFVEGEFPTVAAAMEAVQAEHDRRILSALTAPA